ncbi:MAG: tetratricopeptide repeat protein [Gemmatimonadetes bacterium]|nr:tetratricopeptide repeat protein [Gemmatimonadota bacterium]
MNLEKIKENARKFEAAQDWRRAIEVYQKAIQEYESGQDPSPDVGVYNKVGDLHLKANEPAAAVQVFERAVDLYTDQGFTNNAIALCGKILRVNPGRVQVYLKLAQLHARKNVVSDAKKNLIEYVERMNAFNKLEEAAEAAKKFAEQFADVSELRMLVVELVNAAAREHADNPKLQQLVADLAALADGRSSTAVRRPSRMSTAISKPKAGDLVFLSYGDDEEEAAPAPPPAKASAPAAPAKPATPPPAKPAVPPPPAPKPAPAPAPKPAPAPAPKPAVAPPPAAPKPAPPKPKPAPPPEPEPEPEPLVIERNSLMDEDATPVIEEWLEIESTAIEAYADLPDLEVPDDLPDLTAIETPEEISPADIDLVEAEAPADLALEATPELDESFAASAADEPSSPVLRATGGHAAFTGNTFEPEAAEEAAIEVPALDEPLEFIEAEAPRQLSTAELEERIIDDPENPEHHRSLGEALLAAGETQRGHEELELALDRYEAKEEWPKALDITNELISLDTTAVRFYQKRVELAFRLGDREYLVDSYLELGDALLRSGTVDKAVAVYRRVAEHDPGNQRAATALLTLAGEETPPPKPAAPAKAAPAKPAAPAASAPPAPRTSRPVPVAQDGFVDLGSFIMDDDEPASTRMRIEEEEPSGDEEKDFSSMLSAFKQGIEKTVAEEDFQTHYDLGVAFKEMGLLDEAIGEFQKALRAPEGKLRSSEALGTAFFEKEQYAVAETILKRAVENIAASDQEMLGLYYWLGRSCEAQQKVAEAQAAYQHVTAVNIKFLDTADRVKALR